jgi:hypothetical protein
MIRGVLWNWAPWVYNKLGFVLDTVTRVLKVSYNEVTNSNKWYIIKDVNVPVYSSLFPTTSESIITWICTTNPPRFIAPGTTQLNYKHISYLSCTVNIPGDAPVDITDWINMVKWSGNIEPSLLHLFQLWCCETSKSYFHLIPLVKVILITEMGDEITKGLNDSSTSIASTNDHSGNSSSYIDRYNSNRALDLILSSSGC